MIWRILTGPLRWLWGALAAVAALMAYGASQRRSGAREERAEAEKEALEQALEAERIRNDIEDDIRRDGADPRDRLRNDWSR